MVRAFNVDFADIARSVEGKGSDEQSPSGDAVDASGLSAAEIKTARQWTVTSITGAADQPGFDPLVPFRILAGMPRDALRISMLDAIFPESRFVFVNRDPGQALSRMAAIWQAGTMVTRENLPGWNGLPWSFPLVPGWHELDGAPVAEVVTRQWQQLSTTALDDLEKLSPDRWCVSDFSQLTGNRDNETQRICRFLDLGWHAGISNAVAQSLASSEQEFAALENKPGVEPDEAAIATSARAQELIADNTPRRNP
mgnify:FL=1